MFHIRRLQKFIANSLLLALSVLICLVAAEGATRLIDDLPLIATTLPVPYSGGLGHDTTAQHIDKVPRAAGVAREWYYSGPPPLPNRGAVPQEWLALTRQLETKGTRTPSGFRSLDYLKAWNAAFVGNPCDQPFFSAMPGKLFVYDPPEGDKHPPFRFLPNSTTPAGLVTNEFGWRGPPARFARSPNTIRIVFVGASTIVGPHQFAYALPELIGHWLDLWAAARRPDLRFEVMSAARESLTSTNIEAVIRQEVAPTRPDLVIYSEGGNEFELESIVRNMPQTATAPRAGKGEGLAAWLQNASRYSALARRLQALTGFEGISEGGRELPKPDYEIHWPQGLDEQNPDLRFPNLPVNLTTILRNLDHIRGDLAAVESELALTSFIWMVKDGMVLNPIRNKVLLENLNVVHVPYRYRDLERLAVFQNRVFAKYAAEHRLPFIDVAGRMPLDPDLFADSIHENWFGMRLKAWVILQQLIPIIEQRLESGTWPKPVPTMAEFHPAFRVPPRELTFDCPAVNSKGL
jgi:hypothetical protein